MVGSKLNHASEKGRSPLFPHLIIIEENLKHEV